MAECARGCVVCGHVVCGDTCGLKLGEAGEELCVGTGSEHLSVWERGHETCCFFLPLQPRGARPSREPGSALSDPTGARLSQSVLGALTAALRGGCCALV